MSTKPLSSRTLFSQAFLSRIPELARAFQDAKPFRHVVIDNFLAPDIAERMVADFPSEPDPSRLLNEFGDPNPKSTVDDVAGIGGVYLEMDQFIQSEAFLQAIAQLTGIPDLQYDPWYFGAGTHENFNGAGLDPHYDFNMHPRTGTHRRLNAIVYLNKRWEPEWGGSINFHSDAWDLDNDEVVEVQPVFNRCVVFETTESSWHSVTPVRAPADDPMKSRKSFTIYLYTETRPAAETAPSHATVYVQHGLPKEFRPGVLLSEEMHDMVRANMQRRHYYLRQLYKREYRFAALVEELHAQIDAWKGASGVPVTGAAIARDVREPRYPDGWLGPSMACSVEVTAEIEGVTVHGYCPDMWDEGCELTVAAGPHRVRRVVKPGVFEVTLEGALHPGVTDLVIEAPAARAPGSPDVRELSVVVNRIEFA